MDSPIQIFETDVQARPAGSYGGGWISGSPASLAAAGGVVFCVFDLGGRWDERPILHITVSNPGPATPAAVVVASSDSTSEVGITRRLRDNVGSALRPIADNVAAGTVGSYLVRPMGRYLLIRVTNNDAGAALPATAKVVVGAYPC